MYLMLVVPNLAIYSESPNPSRSRRDVDNLEELMLDFDVLGPLTSATRRAVKYFQLEADGTPNEKIYLP